MLTDVELPSVQLVYELANGDAIYYLLSLAAYAADVDRAGHAADNKAFPVEFLEKECWATFLRQY
jgi:hypothetical protein